VLYRSCGIVQALRITITGRPCCTELICEVNPTTRRGAAAREPHVIVIFRLDPGGSAKYVLRIEDFEQIDQTDLPVFVLFANGHFEGDGGGAMPSSRIDVHEINRCHSPPF